MNAIPANFTRRTLSFPRKFARAGQFHLIPLYWLLRLSDLAREGMDYSGSFRFADHLYRNVASGRGPVGWLLDRLLLSLPSARSMRSRCAASEAAMRKALAAHTGEEPFRLLTVPCGLPRDVRALAAQLGPRIAYRGIDLDPQVIEEARAFLAGAPLHEAELRVGNALDPRAFAGPAPHFIASTGLGEFLDDGALARFYGHVFEALAPGGFFFTSAAARGGGSARLLRAFELDAHYRARGELEPLLARQPWGAIHWSRDAIGLQTFVLAQKLPHDRADHAPEPAR